MSAASGGVSPIYPGCAYTSKLRPLNVEEIEVSMIGTLVGDPLTIMYLMPKRRTTLVVG